MFSEAVREAVDGGISMVVVGGGDGSLLAAVEHFAGTETVLGVLPLGTANSFARALKLPLDLEGAVTILAEGEVRRIDLGLIDGHLYAGCASMGLAPQIAETVPHGLKALGGRPGYLLWAAGQLARFQPFRLTIGEGAAAETLDAVEVRIANGPYHGGVELVDEAKLDSGRIVVQAVVGQNRRDLLFNWAAHAVGAKARRRTTREFEGVAIRISTDPPLPISIDGEVLARTPVTVTVQAGAILVAAPLSQGARPVEFSPPASSDGAKITREAFSLDTWRSDAMTNESPTPNKDDRPINDVREALDAGSHEGLRRDPSDSDAKLDVALDESFPTSDAPSHTRPGSGEPAPSSGYDEKAESAIVRSRARQQLRARFQIPLLAAAGGLAIVGVAVGALWRSARRDD